MTTEEILSGNGTTQMGDVESITTVRNRGVVLPQTWLCMFVNFSQEDVMKLRLPGYSTMD